MKLIEKYTKVGKKQAIIHKYPWWLKWFIKYIQCYYIPDVHDFRIKIGALKPDTVKIQKVYEPPKELSKIYEIT